MDIPVNRVEPPPGVPFQTLSIRFTGSGSEYFRIWIVNMLLLLLTLGLYWPWAKVRRLRYFWGNTLVDGDPLGFHGDPRQMFKGWVLVAVLFGLYNWAGSFSALAGGRGVPGAGCPLAGPVALVHVLSHGQHQLARTAHALRRESS